MQTDWLSLLINQITSYEDVAKSDCRQKLEECYYFRFFVNCALSEAYLFYQMILNLKDYCQVKEARTTLIEDEDFKPRPYL